LGYDICQRTEEMASLHLQNQTRNCPACEYIYGILSSISKFWNRLSVFHHLTAKVTPELKKLLKNKIDIS
jgi:hypothetical protein